jgi:hypothetical protein
VRFEPEDFFFQGLTPRFLYISRKVHPSTLQIGPYWVSRRSGAKDMSVEMGDKSRHAEKWVFPIIHENIFLWKNLNIPLKLAWKMILLVKILLNRSKGLSGNGGFSSKKGYFQQLISRRKKLTLTRDPHQWKSLGVDGRTPGPENPSEVNLLYRSPKCSNIQWIVEVVKFSWGTSLLCKVKFTLLQSIFFPPNFSFVFCKRKIWREKFTL